MSRRNELYDLLVPAKAKAEEAIEAQDESVDLVETQGVIDLIEEWLENHPKEP